MTIQAYFKNRAEVNSYRAIVEQNQVYALLMNNGACFFAWCQINNIDFNNLEEWTHLMFGHEIELSKEACKEILVDLVGKDTAKKYVHIEED